MTLREFQDKVLAILGRIDPAATKPAEKQGEQAEVPANLADQLSKIETALAASDKSNKAEIDKLNASLTAAQTSVTDLKAQLDAEKAKVTKLESELSEAKSKAVSTVASAGVPASEALKTSTGNDASSEIDTLRASLKSERDPKKRGEIVAKIRKLNSGSK